MKIEVVVFLGLLCCILLLSDHALAAIVSSRAVFVLALLFCARWERSMRRREDAVEGLAKLGRESTDSDFTALVGEIRCLGQTVVRLSDQHILLREIRAGVLKTARYSKEALSRAERAENIERARRQLRRGSLSDGCMVVSGSSGFSDQTASQ